MLRLMVLISLALGASPALAFNSVSESSDGHGHIARTSVDIPETPFSPPTLHFTIIGHSAFEKSVKTERGTVHSFTNTPSHHHQSKPDWR